MSILQQAITEAMSTPFLMDEVLAFAAAHRSTLSGEHRDFYCTEATRLQTRALSEFTTAKPEVSEHNCLAIFTFATFLGQHTLFDAFSSHQNSAEVLDKFVQSLVLHAGIRTIASSSWPMIQKMQPELDPTSHKPGISQALDRGDECALLAELLDNSSLEKSTLDACRKDVDLLQDMFDTQRPTHLHGSRRFLVAQEWLVRVSAEYVELVNQRRPEALVILSYYAVLLHRAKDYWVINDGGSFLIRSITNALGAYWASWLRWPNQMLQA
jgi:hypothetical protein